METNPQARYQFELMMANPNLVLQNMQILDQMFGMQPTPNSYPHTQRRQRFGPRLPTAAEAEKYQQQFNGMSTQEMYAFFEKELKQLHEMGMFDDQLNVRALKQANGIVDLAVELIMNWTGQNMD